MEEEEGVNIVNYLDVLPYYDREYEEKLIKQRVKELIAEEMKTINKNLEDYVGHLPKYEMNTWDPEIHPFLHQLNAAVLQKKCLYDKNRYSKVPEYNENMSYEQNVKNLQMVKILREYYYMKKTNLELLKNNRNVLVTMNKGNKNENAYLKEHLTTVNEATSEINKKRKFDQMKAGTTLDRLKVDLNRANQNLAIVSNECERLKKRMKLTHNYGNEDE